MLCEIYCKEFAQKKIEFSDTLNVVLGTNSGDNSIGKSTFMLIIDFVFGGNTYANSKDIVDNVGDHDIFFKFRFNGNDFWFCRNFINNDVVRKCDESYVVGEPIKLKDYRNWLSRMYSLELPDLSFRDAVGRYIRAYGKNNCDEKKPLNYLPKEKDIDAMITVLKLFDEYEVIAGIKEKADEAKTALDTFKKAQNLNFVSKISKGEYKKNENEKKMLSDQINEIVSSVEYNLMDIDVEKSEYVIEIKSKITRARKLRSYSKSKLKEIEQQEHFKHVNIKDTLDRLLIFFPEANIKQIEEIEAFHSKISKIFNKELELEKRRLMADISDYDSIIDSYETKLKEVVDNPNVSKLVLQRYAELLNKKDKIEKENSSYDTVLELKESYKLYEHQLSEMKTQQFGIIEHLINKEMEEINAALYDEDYNAPIIHFTDNSYVFSTPNDTGTGVAYKGLVVFDLAIARLTNLPIIVHDSVVLKQISDGAVERIMQQYIKCGKQTIIAFDKQDSYTDKTVDILEKYTVLKLIPNGKELFGRFWGKS